MILMIIKKYIKNLISVCQNLDFADLGGKMQVIADLYYLF